jgi:hypothetical protein
VQEQTEVVAGRGEHGVDPIAVAPFEIIAPHPVLGLDVPNDRFDGGAAAHLAADRGGDAAYLAANPYGALALPLPMHSTSGACEFGCKVSVITPATAAISCEIDYFTRRVSPNASTLARFFTDDYVVRY